MELVLVEHSNDRLIRVKLVFPSICLDLTDQFFRLVSLVDDHVVFSPTSLPDFANQVGNRAVAFLDELVDLRVSFSHESSRWLARLRDRRLPEVVHY